MVAATRLTLRVMRAMRAMRADDDSNCEASSRRWRGWRSRHLMTAPPLRIRRRETVCLRYQAHGLGNKWMVNFSAV
jgi:hypothetical protein